jgi:hypothetical protein
MKIGDKLFKDTEIEKLFAIMESLDNAAREEVLNSIGRRLNQASRISSVNRIKELVQTTDPLVKDWIAKAIPNSYIMGMYEGDKELRRRTANITIDDLKTLKAFSIHAEAVNLLMGDAYMDFANGMNGLVRGSEKQISEALKRQARAKIAGNILSGSDIRQTKKDIIKILGDKGFSVLSDRGGTEWSLKRYSEMLARTHTIRAFNDATVNRAAEFGMDLVEVSSHGGSCPVCAALEGQIYSISGNSDKYPKLDIGFPIHPNCTHNLIIRPNFDEQ